VLVDPTTALGEQMPIAATGVRTNEPSDCATKEYIALEMETRWGSLAATVFRNCAQKGRNG
jgi:hypothetical protein